MHISDTGYNFNTGNNIFVNTGEVPGDTAGITGSGDEGTWIKDAAPGQLFAGQILDITKDQVSILLENNIKMQARLGENVNLNIGDSIVFQVKENTGESILIRPVNNSLAKEMDSTVYKVLEQNNLAMSEKNYHAVKALMDNGMPIDKGTLVKILNQSYKFPDAPIKMLVIMNKYNIPVNKENISQLKDYMENQHQLTNNITRLEKDLLCFAETVMADIENTCIDKSEMKKQVLDFNFRILSAICDENELENISKAGETIHSNIINEETIAPFERLDVSRTDIRQIFNFLQSEGFGKENLEKVINKSDSALRLLNNINYFLSNNKDIDIDVSKLFSLDGYKRILSRGIRDKFSLEPQKMESPLEINHMYQSLYEKAGKIMESFGHTGDFGENLKDTAKGVQERLDFIQNLNSMFGYSQIPVKMSSSEVNSELLVYINQGKIRKGKEDISALLHLDMEHLGPTDVHVSLKGGIVSTRFYVEDEESAVILTKYMNMLEQAVKEKGYILSNQVITRQPEQEKTSDNIIMNMLGTDLEKSIKRYSFDVKM